MHRSRLDIGSGKGRCTEGGLGVELSPAKARIAKREGHLVVVANGTLPIVKPKSFEEVTLFHVLEHLPDLGAVKKMIYEATQAATKTIYIRGPWFDADEYLEQEGLALYWSTWECHQTHLTTRQLEMVLISLGLIDYEIKGKAPLVKGSLDLRIHVIGYEAGGPWNENHPPKKQIGFHFPIYNQLTCTIHLGEK
jgi:hypothetical protein